MKSATPCLSIHDFKQPTLRPPRRSLASLAAVSIRASSFEARPLRGRAPQDKLSFSPAHMHEGAERREGAGAERRTLVLAASSPANSSECPRRKRGSTRNTLRGVPRASDVGARPSRRSTAATAPSTIAAAAPRSASGLFPETPSVSRDGGYNSDRRKEIKKKMSENQKTEFPPRRGQRRVSRQLQR